jgi:hypothetical protein
MQKFQPEEGGRMIFRRTRRTLEGIGMLQSEAIFPLPLYCLLVNQQFLRLELESHEHGEEGHVAEATHHIHHSVEEGMNKEG